MRIGDIELPAGAALAPMAGVTDANMRVLCREQGSAWAVSEMLSAKGYVYAPERRVHKEITHKDPREGMTGLQLFGSEQHMLTEAVKLLNESAFEFFDFNMGCPAHKIVTNGEGCALMREPAKAGRLIEAMVKASAKPVTVKIRAGWDAEHINAREIARVVELSGASAVTVHPRTRDMFYSGHAAWDIIADVKQSVRIPVIGNGDIRSGGDAVNMLTQTGCDAVMVARAAQGNIWIFAEILCALTGGTFTPPSPGDRIRTALRHTDMQILSRGEEYGIAEMRKFIAWYTQGLPSSASLRAGVNGYTRREQIHAALNEYLAKTEKG
ncbi:MAG: tRNA dihydrouridine synthase DusB [Clostridia bacterium]|nr:tRNA dihydrouridine synthase DusB [Clostridia bacterium]